jgi:hypothetical protein
LPELLARGSEWAGAGERQLEKLLAGVRSAVASPISATMRRMGATELRMWCLRQAGAIEDFPFGPEHSVFKVAGKMFA